MSHRWHRVFCILLLSFFLTSVWGTLTGAASESDGGWNSGSITVKSTFTMTSDPENGKTIVLARLATDDKGHLPVLTATWELEASSWFSSWYVKIAGEQLIPSEAVKPGTETLRLGPIAPVANHVYEVTLSYHPTLGYLAFSLVDQTAGKRICGDNWLVNRYIGTLYSVADAGTSVVSYPWYEPSGAQWDVGTGSTSGFMPMRLLEPAGDNWIRLTALGPLPGEYQVVTSSGKQVTSINGTSLKSGENLFPLPSVSLPLGSNALALQYVERNQVVSTDRREIVVGKVIAALDNLEMNSSTHTLSGNLVVQSESVLRNVTLRLQVDISNIVWNAATANYVSQPDKSMVIELGRQAELPAGTAALPVSFSVPDQPGLWRADFKLLADPTVNATIISPGIVYSTYTWSVLGNDSVKAIRIGSYNIYGFYGYPDNDARAVLGYTNDPRRIEYYTNVIKALSCDIIGIQEGASIEQMVRYAKAAGMEAAAHPSATAYPGGVFTTFPILESRSYSNTSPGGKTEPFSRTGLVTLLNVRGELLWVVNIHAHVNNVELRQREAEILDRELPELAKVTPNIVVTGDFNSMPGEEIHEALRKHNLYNAMQVLALIPPNQYTRAIDCVYVSESLVGYLQAGQFYSNPGLADSTGKSTWRDSDHRPLVVELGWPR